MVEKKKQSEWKLVGQYGVAEYKCGLRQGDKIRLKKDIQVTYSDGVPSGDIHRAGEIWSVLSGSPQDPDIVFLLQPDGKRHTWSDDSSIFDAFEKFLVE